MTVGLESRPALPGVPTLGFDLDLTLVDMLAATRFALGEVNRRLGVCIDIDDVLSDLGAPFRERLSTWVPPHQLRTAMRNFHQAFVSGGVTMLEPIDGATEVLAALRAIGGRSVVITGRSGSVARRCLERCGLRVDAVCGGVVGLAKAPAMRRYRIDAFIGDHVLDIEGARSAGIPGVGLLSGGHDETQLRAAGASAVVSSVAVIADWLIAVPSEGPLPTQHGNSIDDATEG